MKACDVVTGLRAEVEQWRTRAIRAETQGTGHDQIECQRAEIERLRADLARSVAERDEARTTLATLRPEYAIARGALRQLQDQRASERAYVARLEQEAADLRAEREDVEALKADLARAMAERDDARAIGRGLSDEIRTHREAARMLLVVMYGAERDVCAVGTHIQAAATLIANQRIGMERLQRQRDEARAAARLTTVPAGGRIVSADVWERLSALADAVREVPDAD